MTLKATDRSSSSAVLALMLCALTIAMLMMAPTSAHAAYTLTSGNSAVSIDPSSATGVYGWTVDGVNQLSGNWWYYRIGENAGALINSLGTPVATQLGTNVLDLRYSGQFIDLTLRYTLQGGAAGSGNSTLAESIRIKNKTAQVMPLHLFEYTDLDLNDTSDDDSIAQLSASTIGQWDGAIITTETASAGGMTPAPNHWEVANASDLLTKMNSGSILSLSDCGAPLIGNGAFAFQWDMNINAGATQLLSKSKVLMRGGAIGDTVWFDSNGDGIQDIDEPGIANVKVNLSADFNGDGAAEYTNSITTDSNGYYLFANLPAGHYTITLDQTTLPAGVIQTYDLDGLDTPASTTIDLKNSQVNLDVDFGYWQLASVGDRVWNDLNGNGAQDAGEPGINGVRVNLKNADGEVITSATTTGDGIYGFADLRPGTYTVSVDAATLPAGLKQTYDLDGILDNSSTVTLAAGDKRTDVDFGYQQLGSIGDRVWNDLNNNGVQDAGEPGINDVTVNIKDTAGNVISTTKTSGDGLYLFGNLPAGSYIVSVDEWTLPAGSEQTYDLDGILDDSTTVALAAGENRRDADFGYWQPATIGDRVWHDMDADGVQDSGEPGIVGAIVTLKDGSGSIIGTTTTVEDGIYQFTNLPAGAYFVSVSLPASHAAMAETYERDNTLDNSAGAAIEAGEVRKDIDFGFVGNTPGITLVKTGPATAKIGDTITYHFKVANTGNTVLNNVTVTDPLLGGVIRRKSSLAVGETVEFDKTYTITSASVSSSASIACTNRPPTCGGGNLVNKATVTGTAPSGQSVTDQSSCTTVVGKTSGSLGDRVWLDKDADGVQDAGEQGINGVRVVLKDSSGRSIASTVTSGDGIYSFTNLQAGTYTVCVDTSCLPWNAIETFEIDGSLNSRATVTLNAGQNRTDVDFGYTVCKPGIDLVKTGPATAKTGDTITYHFKVTNTGNTVLNITVDDPMLGGTIWQKCGVAPGEVNEFDRTYVVKSASSGGCRVLCCYPEPNCGSDDDTIVNTATAIGCPPYGCKVTSTSSCSTTITKNSGYTTYTQGGWGSCPNGNNPGALLANNFYRVYGCCGVAIGSWNWLAFTNARAVRDFLPQGGKAGALRWSEVNPCGSSAGVFAGQVLALKLNVDFSNAGITKRGLGSVRLTSGALRGWTISQVLDLAEEVLGGDTWALPCGMSISQLNDVVDGINNSYDRG